LEWKVSLGWHRVEESVVLEDIVEILIRIGAPQQDICRITCDDTKAFKVPIRLIEKIVCEGHIKGLGNDEQPVESALIFPIKCDPVDYQIISYALGLKEGAFDGPLRLHRLIYTS
jgi:hypothetical protein